MIIAVASGQAGVGKTSVSLNLSIALSRSGKKVWLLDADMGLANISALLGVQPEMNLNHILFEGKTAGEVAFNGPSGVKVISGGPGIEELARIDKSAYGELSSAFSGLASESDFLIVDTSSDSAPENLAFSRAADAVIVIFTPEQASLADGFYVIQELCANQYAGGIYLLPNMFESTRSAATTTEKIKAEAAKSLSRKLEHLPPLPKDNAVADAGARQRPFMEANPSSAAAMRMGEIAAKVASIAVSMGDNKTAPADYILGVAGYANDTKLTSLASVSQEQVELNGYPLQDNKQPGQETYAELTAVSVDGSNEEAVYPGEETSTALMTVSVDSSLQEPISPARDAEWSGEARGSGEFMKYMESPIKTIASAFEKNSTLFEKTLEILSGISERISSFGHHETAHTASGGANGKKSSLTPGNGKPPKSVEVIMDFDRFVLNKLQANKNTDNKSKA